MSARIALALSVALGLGCSSGDADGVRAAQAEEQTLAKEAQSKATGTPAAPAGTCAAQSGIWTTRFSPMTAATATACVSPTTTSGELGTTDGSNWSFLTPGVMNGCNRGTTVDPDGCSMICDRQLDGPAEETVLTIESATRMTGSYVATLSDGTRCEYDVTATKG